MSGHADAITEALTRLTNQDRFEAPYADAAQDSLDALLAENQRYEKALTWISDPSYVGSYSEADVVEIHRKWAREALAGEDG